MPIPKPIPRPLRPENTDTLGIVEPADVAAEADSKIAEPTELDSLDHLVEPTVSEPYIQEPGALEIPEPDISEPFIDEIPLGEIPEPVVPEPQLEEPTYPMPEEPEILEPQINEAVEEPNPYEPGSNPNVEPKIYEPGMQPSTVSEVGVLATKEEEPEEPQAQAEEPAGEEPDEGEAEEEAPVLEEGPEQYETITYTRRKRRAKRAAPTAPSITPTLGGVQ